MGLTGNYHLVTRHYDVALPQLDAAYDGYRILQVSDVHNALQEIVGGLDALLDVARLARPHVIAITGDLLDRHSPDVTSSCALIRGLSAIAPVYYVTGNHERTPLGSDGLPLPYRRVTPERAASLYVPTAQGGEDCADEGALPRFDDLFTRNRDAFETAGIHVLEGKTVELSPLEGAAPAGLVLCGVRDPWPLTVTNPGAWESLLGDVVQRARDLSGPRGATVLLPHRPERVEDYERAGVNVALAGHAHGGKVRVPGIGALIAPNQGLLPRYSRGLYRVGATQLVVSSGVGTTGYRLRVLCPPELVVVRLRCGAGVQNDSTQR